MTQTVCICNELESPAARRGDHAEWCMLYARAEFARLRAEPVTCWKCGGEVLDDPSEEHCPHCGADRVPF